MKPLIDYKDSLEGLIGKQLSKTRFYQAARGARITPGDSDQQILAKLKEAWVNTKPVGRPRVSQDTLLGSNPSALELASFPVTRSDIRRAIATLGLNKNDKNDVAFGYTIALIANYSGWEGTYPDRVRKAFTWLQERTDVLTRYPIGQS